MNKEIKDWLQSSDDYSVGEDLYKRFGPSQNLKRLFSHGGDSQANTQTLYYELSKLVHVPPTPAGRPRPAGTGQSEPSRPPAAAIILPPSDNECKTMMDEAIQLMKIRDAKFNTLELVSLEQRRKDALLILDLSDQITECYLSKEHYDKTGVLVRKENKTEVKKKSSYSAMTSGELINSRASIRSQISRYKRLIKDTTLIARLSFNTLALMGWERQLAEVEKYISKYESV